MPSRDLDERYHHSPLTLSSLIDVLFSFLLSFSDSLLEAFLIGAKGGICCSPGRIVGSDEPNALMAAVSVDAGKTFQNQTSFNSSESIRKRLIHLKSIEIFPSFPIVCLECADSFDHFSFVAIFLLIFAQSYRWWISSGEFFTSLTSALPGRLKAGGKLKKRPYQVSMARNSYNALHFVACRRIPIG